MSKRTLIFNLVLLIATLFLMGCPEDNPKGLTRDCQTCIQTDENKNFCFDSCAGFDANGNRRTDYQPSTNSVNTNSYQPMSNTQPSYESISTGSLDKWGEYITKNLDSESVSRYLRYKSLISFKYQRCGENLAGHAPYDSRTNRVTIFICQGRSEVEQCMTIAHELVHADTMISTQGKWDHTQTALAECRYIQQKQRGLLSGRYEMCGMSDDYIIGYGNENGGTISETEK